MTVDIIGAAPIGVEINPKFWSEYWNIGIGTNPLYFDLVIDRSIHKPAVYEIYFQM